MKKQQIKFSRSAIAFFLMIAPFGMSKVMAQQRNFSGTWLRNEVKTDYGTLSKAYFGPPSIQIVKGNNFYQIKQDTIAIHDTKLAFDGSETESLITGTGGDRKKLTKMKWIDKSSFIDSSNYSGSLNYSSTKKYILSADGKELTIIMRINYQPENSVFNVKLIYNRLLTTNQSN